MLLKKTKGRRVYSFSKYILAACAIIYLGGVTEFFDLFKGLEKTMNSPAVSQTGSTINTNTGGKS